MIHVCSLARLEETIEATGARHVVSLVSTGTPLTRPAMIEEANHLTLFMHDIIEALPGLEPPEAHHVERFLDFVRGWPRRTPLIVHCYAGISRSTAAAYIAAAALVPDRDEAELARELRDAAPSATPNARLVAIADELLGREGRMVRAIAAIGRGADAFEGTPFRLAIDPEAPEPISDQS